MQVNARKIKLLKLDVYTAIDNQIEQGFILIELLIAIFISTSLLNLVMKIYLTSEKVLQNQTTLMQIQSNAHETISILNNEIKKAGHIGCAKLTSEFSPIPFRNYSLNIKNKLMGNDNEITIRYADYPSAILVKNMNNKKNLSVNRNIKFTSGDILLISNCKWAEIFQVAKVKISRDTQEITSTSPLTHDFDSNSEISHFIINHYFINKTNRTHRDGSFVYALFLESNHQYKNELVADITHMSLKYSLYQQGILMDKFASQITDWSSVKGVAIELKLGSSQLKKSWYGYASLSQ